MDRETLNAFAHLARTFAQKEIRPMVGQETRDGDLDKVPSILDKAQETGLMASPHPQAPGYEYGVWGRACLTDGPTASLVILEETARECAGVALCLHATGLGGLELEEPLFKRPGVAFFHQGERLTWDLLEPGPPLSPGYYTVLVSPGWEGLVLYQRSPQGWNTRALAKEETDWEDLIPRTGLAAAGIIQVEVASEGRATGEGDPEALLRRHLLGLTAIALGNALGAITAAREYASQRYQGGAKINEHSAVKLLLGEATARVESLRSQLYWTAQEDRETTDALIRAMALATRGLEEAWRATSDALQVLGGYGYMEDYRLEKRLRDAMTLRTLPPSSRDLSLMLGSPREGEEG